MSEVETLTPAADTVAFKSYVGILGNIFAMLLFIAPITLMIKLHKRQVDPLNVPYLIMLMNIMNCVLWLSYGIITSDIFLGVCNGVGFGFNIVYLCLYFIYRFRKDLKNALIYDALAVISTTFILVLYAWVFKSQGVAQYSAMIFNIFMYAAPGQKLREVVKTGDNRLIALPSTIVGLLCSIAWLTYGTLPIFNIFIVIPNGIGVFLSVVNIFIYFYYLKSTKRVEEYEKKLTGKKVNESANEVNKPAKSIPAEELNSKVNASSSVDVDTKNFKNDSEMHLNNVLQPRNMASSDTVDSDSRVYITSLKDLDNLANDYEKNNQSESVIVHVP